jgi:hypothetical protein
LTVLGSLPNLVFLPLLVLWLGSAAWIARDASRRGRDAGLWGLAAIFCFPLSILAWLATRDRTLRP